MYGISTFCLHDVPLPAALEQIAPLVDHIEVMDEGRHFLQEASTLQSYSCRFSIHAPCRGTNIASLLEPIRRASVEVLAQCFAIAAEVGASVVVHPGYFAWPEERQNAEDRLRRSLTELTRSAEEHSVHYYIENMGNWEYFLIKTPEELGLIGRNGFALDVGHANQNHCLREFLKYPAGHYHLHDNDGKEDSHLAVGKGTIDFTPVLRSIREHGGTPVIEVATFDGVVESLAVLNQIEKS
jgi:sugar phosphate isomerase/epimerase